MATNNSIIEEIKVRLLPEANSAEKVKKLLDDLIEKADKIKFDTNSAKEYAAAIKIVSDEYNKMISYRKKAVKETSEQEKQAQQQVKQSYAERKSDETKLLQMKQAFNRREEENAKLAKSQIEDKANIEKTLQQQILDKKVSDEKLLYSEIDSYNAQKASIEKKISSEMSTYRKNLAKQEHDMNR